MKNYYNPIFASVDSKIKETKKNSSNLVLKAFFALLLMIGVSGNVWGQVSVTATAGTLGPTAYTTLKLAFDAVNAGTHQGAINIAISSNTSEGATPAVLNSSVAPANYSSININPTNDAVTISGGVTPASRGVIELNGADNVTINGDNPNTAGTNRNLTITLTGTNASVLLWMKTVSATNGCTGNTFRNCNFQGQTTTNVTTAGILAGSSIFGAAAAVANSNITIANNTFTRVQNGIFHFGFATSTYDANWSITGNTFGSTAVAGDKLIFRGMILQNISGSTISNNVINGVVSSTASTSNMSGIQFAAASSNCSVFGNRISDIKQMNTTGYGAIGINIGCTSTASNLNIYNNFIWDVAGRGYSTSTVNDNGYGIALTAGGGYNLYYNTVRMNTNQTSATGHPYALLINGVTTASSLNIRNNIFTNETTVGAAGTLYCVYSAAANTVFADINYNDYYFTGTNLGFLGSARANLAAWQTATAKDAQSLSVTPTFVSATDLHLASTSCPLDGKGTPIATFTTDYDAATRDALTPDIGADEFSTTLPTISGTLSICGITGTTSLTGSGTAAAASPWASSSTGVATISGSGTTGSVTAVAAGTTTITYTTNTGCQQTATVTVNALPTISGTLSICNTGTTALTGSGTAAASNPWTSSNTGVATISGSGTTGTVTGVSAGTTTITYTASTGCQKTATVTVIFTPTCSSSASPTGAGQTALGVTLSWSAVSAATSYDVYFGTDGGGTTTPTNILNGVNQAGTSYSTGALSGLTTYYYQIVPKNTCGSASGCTIYSFTTSAACTAPTFSATPTNTLCVGASNGSISVSASGGTSPYQYSNDNGTTWQSSSSFAGLAAGAYFIVVKGDDGCTALASSTTVSNPTALTASVTSATLSGCSGSTVSLGGSASGGTGTLTYSWSPTTGLSSSSAASPSLTVTGSQTYTLTVTDANGCTSNQPTVAVSIGGGITKYWAGSGSGMTGGTAGTDFNTAANWSSTTGTKTAVSSSPQSCDDAVITLTSAATITLSANATVNSLNFTTVFNAAGAILDIQTFNLTTIASYAINMSTGGGASSMIEQRIGNGAILTVGGNASIGTGPVTAGFVIIRGSGGAGVITTGVLTFKGNVSMGDGYGTSSASTSNFGKVIFDGTSTQTVSTGATYGFDFQTNYVQIGNINSPAVSFTGPQGWGIYGSSPTLHVKSNSTLNINASILNKDLLCSNGPCTTFYYTAGGSIILEAGSLLKLSGATGGQTGSNFPFNFTTYTFDPTSTVEYYGATQTVFATPAYGHLTLSTSGTKTAGAALTVVGNLLINSPATFAAGTSLTHNVGGNWTNNGTFGFTTANTINFNGAALQTISGSSTTGFSTLTMNKGTSVATILDVTGAGAVTVATALNFTNGLLRISTGGSFTHNGSGPTIAATAGLHVNGGTFTLSGASTTNNGWVRVSSGTATFGTGSGNGIANQTTGYFDVSGGTVNIGGRLENTANGTANAGVPGTGVAITGGTITVCTNANTSGTVASFNMSATSNLSMTNGTVIVQTPNTNATPFNDINILSGGTKSISGGTFQIGNASTAASKTFLINSAININNLTINSTNAPVLRLVTSNLSLGTSGVLTMNGGNIDGATNLKDVIVTNSATTAVVRTAGYVNYKLQRAVANTSAYLWPVGFGTNYTPASLSNLATGNLTVLANSGDQGNYATASLDIAKSVNTFWTLSGTSSSAYDGTLTYPSALNDDAAVVASYQVGKYNAGWTYPSVSGTPTTTNISFTGANGLGDLIAAKCKTVTTSTNGPTQTICQTSTATLAGQAPGATAEVGTWSVTSGPSLLTTQFANVNAYNTIFTPAGGVGSYVLTWTINLPSPAACSNPSASSVTINVNASPTATAGGTQTICQTGTATVSGASSTNGTILWTENGAGSITAGATTLTPTYTAAAGDAGNTVTLTMTVSNSPCTAATATYSVVVNASPTATAGGTQTICQTGTATVSGATSSNGTILWTSNGAGSLTNASTLTPTYTPAAGDAGTTVTLTMTVTSTNACSPQTATATYSVVVNATPTATAGGGQTICQTGTATVSGATSSNGTILWTENGAGSITAGATTLTPTYTAAAGDAGNTVTLTMTVSNGTCIAATATYFVVVNALPTTANAGSNQTSSTTCGLTTVALAGNIASVGTGAWTVVSGAGGSFVSATNPTANFSGTAGATYVLRWTISNSPCSASTSDVIITFNQNPTVTALANPTTICEGQSATLSGSGANTYSWNNGAGSGASVSVLPTSNTTYTVTGTDINGCTNTANATVTVNNTADFANLQFPQSASISCGSSVAVYGKIYDASLTPVAGANATITVEVGVSVSNTDPSTWASGAWSAATYNAQVFNDDEYIANIGSTLTPGTYYYTFRYQIGSTGCYKYGGYNSGFWNGTTNVNGTLTVNGSILDYANVQFPTSGSICIGGSYTVYGQVYEAGVTNAAGAAAGMIAEIGVSNSNTNPSTWAAGAWSSASFNAQSGNNDEFVATIGSSLASGTYYYAFRYKLSSACNYQYGAVNGFWNGTTNTNGVLTVAAAATSTVSNGDYVWKGTTNTDWSTASNWLTYNGTTYSVASVPPTSSNKVIIPTLSTGCVVSQPATITNLSGNANDILIETGASLGLSSATLSVSGNWTNNGTFTPGTGTVAFVGTSGNQTITKTNGETFAYMTVNKSSGNVVLNNNVTVVGGLALTNGKVELGTNNLTMGGATLTGGSSSSYVKTASSGFLKRDLGNSGAVFFPVGNTTYNPAELTNTIDSDVFSVRVVDAVYINGTSGNLQTTSVVNRTWMIGEETQGGNSVKMKLYWNGVGEEATGFTANQAFIAHYVSSASMWDNMGGTQTASGYVESTQATTTFSPFTISSSPTFAPLPVELLSLDAHCAGENVIVAWKTASEHNSLNFVVERSEDGTAWSEIQTVGAAGNSNTIIEYAIEDAGAARGVKYYRLIQVDQDGVQKIYGPVISNCGSDNNLFMSFPNPSDAEITIVFNDKNIIGSTTLMVRDAHGRVVRSIALEIQPGTNSILIPDMELEPAVYYLQLVGDNFKSPVLKHSLR